MNRSTRLRFGPPPRSDHFPLKFVVSTTRVSSSQYPCELPAHCRIDSLDAAETRLWSGEADFEPWLAFYLGALGKHAEKIRSKIDLERRALEFSPLQRKILETVREHGTVGAGLLIEATGANRNTLKDNLRRMVDRGLLERFGERRGSRYKLATP